MATICLWFDGQAREAAEFYTGVLRDGKLGAHDEFGSTDGSDEVTVAFEAEGISFLGLNGGPQFQFTEAVSVMLFRDTQAEIDELWDALLDGGGEESMCGWLKDRYGFSWQVVPSGMAQWVGGPDAAGAERARQAMFGMRKLDIAELEAAYRGAAATV
ncbi:MAG: hypothetical protein JWM98_2065 [Thermoleophilia bacterium]|nr:hypothetical protein [Thermoleophilia bacterium]